MESGTRTEGSALHGGGGSGGDGLLCHACGYQYPNSHPSAKQRRAHRKHCGKPATSAAAAGEGAAGERESRELLPGEGGGGAAAGGGEIGASSAECGGGLPGSAPEVGDAVEDGDNAEHSSGEGIEPHQAIEDKYAEDCLISCNNIPSEITSEAVRNDNDGNMTTLAIQDSKKGSIIEHGDPSDPASSTEQLQSVPASVLLPEPEDGARFSSETSEYELQNSSVVSLASNTTGGGMSEQTNDVSELSGIAVTAEDGMINTTGKNKPSEDISVKGDEFGLSYQGNLETKIDEEHCTTVVEQDSSDKNPAIHNEEIPNDETESSQQSKLMLANQVKEFPTAEEPLESITEKSVGTDDDLLKSGTDGCHSEMLDTVEPQQQPDSTSVTADHLAIPSQAENVEGHHYSNTDGGIQAIPSAIGSAVAAKIVPVDGSANSTDNIYSSDVTVGDNMQKNVTTGTVIPTQVDLVEVTTSVAADEIHMVGSTNDADGKGQNEKIISDLTPHEVNEMHIAENIEEKQQNKEVITDPSSHETNVVSGTDNYEENEHNEESIAGTSSHKISAVQNTTIEEKEPIEESIANSASEKTNETSSRHIVEEKKQDETDIKTNGEIDVACNMETIGENNASSSETSVWNTTDNVEDKMQNEESTAGPTSQGINMICSTNNEEKMHNEEMTVSVHGADNVEEKAYEETTANPTSYKSSVLTSTDSVVGRKDDKTTADPTSQGLNVTGSTDNVKEKKDGEPILDPRSTSIGTLGSVGDVKGKQQNEETTADPRSGENNTLGNADDPKNKQQNADTTTDPSPGTIGAAQNTNDMEEREKTEDTATKEINTIENADDPKGADQNEEIADKEMVADSDRSHVSLKVLLADKNVETKEKKTSTKERVLSLGRRASKDNVSPVKPGSPKASSGQQDWNSPARLPSEKKPKGRKHQWVPFICCSSIQ